MGCSATTVVEVGGTAVAVAGAATEIGEAGAGMVVPSTAVLAPGAVAAACVAGAADVGCTEAMTTHVGATAPQRSG